MIGSTQRRKPSQGHVRTLLDQVKDPNAPRSSPLPLASPPAVGGFVAPGDHDFFPSRVDEPGHRQDGRGQVSTGPMVFRSRERMKAGFS